MAFAKILAPLTGGPRDPIVLAGALAAAEPFASHVEALFVKPDPVEAMPFYGEGMSSAVVQEIVDVSREATARASDTARAALTAATAQHGAELLARPERRDKITASFREVQGQYASQVSLAARLADLVVFGPLKEGDRPGLTEAFEATLIDTGRPVLLFGEMPKPKLLETVALAWNGSPGAAHAAIEAMPFLEKARGVDILSAAKASAESAASDTLNEYLRLHGIAARNRTRELGEGTVADILLAAAKEAGAGLLVAGGFGRRHNRIREMFVIGTTRRLIANATIPLFLAH